MSCWIGDNKLQSTPSSAVQVASDQDGGFEAVFVLMEPTYLGEEFGMGCTLSFGAPGLSIGEGKVIEFMGYWKGLVP